MGFLLGGRRADGTFLLQRDLFGRWGLEYQGINPTLTTQGVWW